MFPFYQGIRPQFLVTGAITGNDGIIFRATKGCRRSRVRHLSATSASQAAPHSIQLPPKSPFPYPERGNPTPHQIFHLPHGATRTEIKTRYFELVRAHHPDSSFSAHLPPEIAHARFRSIKASYDFLRGRTMSPHPNARPSPTPKSFDPYLHELAQRRRAYYASRGGYNMGEEDGFEKECWAKPGWGDGFGAPRDEQSEWNGDGLRERLILAFGVVVLLAGLFPTLPFSLTHMLMPTSHMPFSSFSLLPDINKNHRVAVSALVEARQERQDIGAERRESVRRRVREMNENDATLTKDQPS